MTNSGYDVENDYRYFKAGVYNQIDSGDPDDNVQATVYELVASHNEYVDQADECDDSRGEPAVR